MTLLSSVPQSPGRVYSYVPHLDSTVVSFSTCVQPFIVAPPCCAPQAAYRSRASSAGGNVSASFCSAPSAMTSSTRIARRSPALRSDPSPGSIISFQVVPPSSDQPMFFVFRRSSVDVKPPARPPPSPSRISIGYQPVSVGTNGVGEVTMAAPSATSSRSVVLIPVLGSVTWTRT